MTTFEVLGGSFVGKDRNMVYRSGQRLPHIDPATCKFILHNPYGYQVISDRNGVYLNKLKFLHANAKTFRMIDKRTGRDDRHVFLVDTWHSTPVTVYKTGELLVAETVLYEKGTTNALATVKAELTDGKVKSLALSPPPSEALTHPVPDWQIDIFQRPDMIKLMVASGDLLE